MSRCGIPASCPLPVAALSLFSCILLMTCAGCGTTGTTTRDTLWLHGNQLPEPMPYKVYTPPGWDSVTPLPLVILLHNRTEKPAVFQQYGVIDQLHQWMAEGRITPAILAIPESRHGLWWNYHDRSYRYTDCIIHDLIPAIAGQYPVRSGSQYLHVFGTGTGAMAAVDMAVRHPGTFGSAGSLNGWFLDAAGAAEYVRHKPFPDARRIFGPPENSRAMTARSVYDRVRTGADIPGTRFILGYCSLGGWNLLENNETFREHLASLGIPHDFVVFYSGRNTHAARFMAAVYVALQLGLRDLYGEVNGIAYQVLKYR